MAVAEHKLTMLTLKYPKLMIWGLVVLSFLVVAGAAIPTLWPVQFTNFNKLIIDTDPENMLSPDEPVRVFHNAMKKKFAISDIIVVGIVNDKHPEGVFNPESLKRIYQLAQFSKTLKWVDEKNPDNMVGVIGIDMIAPSMVDSIDQAGLGAVSFNWLMPQPPENMADALLVRDRALKIPTLNDTMVSKNGRAISLYLPISDKHLSFRIREQLLAKISQWQDSDDKFHITGLPVAEDVFGVEMFVQMAISAPAAMLVIFILMWVFFRNIQLITAPMIIAMVCSMLTMGLLVLTGNTVHIMSSMIPIFIMPIAVLDAVHILSEFYDRYKKGSDKKQVMVEVMNELYKPMLYTTLTTSVGFFSLALTPIPPVQTFGVFIAIGVILAWFMTVTFVPAYILGMSDKSLENFGMKQSSNSENNGILGKFLQSLGNLSFHRYKLVCVGLVAIIFISAVGISKIVINDNPIKWFEKSHPIRIADRVLNENFGGTYLAYLAILPSNNNIDIDKNTIDNLLDNMDAVIKTSQKSEITNLAAVFNIAKQQIIAMKNNGDVNLQAIANWVEDKSDQSDDDKYDAWGEILTLIDDEISSQQIFKQPAILKYMEGLQLAIEKSPIVGKTNGLTDVIKTVHRELFLGKDQAYRIPDTQNAVAQSLITFQSSHKPHDLWHFVTPDYRNANIMVQLNSGDNIDMSSVIDLTDQYIKNNPLPYGLQHKWFGLTYINVVWQDKMVSGMLDAFLGSFALVLIMMIILFRSIPWGIISMIPLTLSVAFIYAILGFIGKDYDMPVAVLSALSLGLAVDYSIHFISRSREATAKFGNWREGHKYAFGEPARAIARNAIVLGLGFSPLLMATLIPYNTVGVLIAAILITSGLATLVILPAIITLMPKVFFKENIS